MVAGLAVLAAAWLLPPTRSHPVTPAMLTAAGGVSGSRLPGVTLEASDDRPTVLVFT